MTTTKTTTTTELGSKLAYLTRALKTPTIARVWDDLAAQARNLSRRQGVSSKPRSAEPLGL